MQLTVGSVYQGKVTGITKFGVFVELEKGTTGLVHISEVATSFVNDINEFVKVEDEVSVKVLSIDGNKISLSMKRANESDNEKSTFKSDKKFTKNRTSAPPVYESKNNHKSDAPMSFEEMMSKFKQSSDEKYVDLKRKNGDRQRTNRRAPK